MSVLALLVWLGYQQSWTGFGDKTLWSWLELLIVPAVLAIGALLFNRAEQKARTRIEARRRHEQDLQNYLDKMTKLVLEHGLRRSESGSDVRDAARTLTLTTLRELDGERKGIILDFLHESGLIRYDPTEKADEVVSLVYADLRSVQLQGKKFYNVSLQATDLRGARMSQTYLAESSLFNSKLSGADLSDAWLLDTDLGGAELSGVDLTRAVLSGYSGPGPVLLDCNLQDAILREAVVHLEQLVVAHSLRGATMFDGSRYDGRLRLFGDTREEVTTGQWQERDTSDSRAMAAYYGVSVETYERGQRWAEKNLKELRERADALRRGETLEARG